MFSEIFRHLFCQDTMYVKETFCPTLIVHWALLLYVAYKMVSVVSVFCIIGIKSVVYELLFVSIFMFLSGDSIGLEDTTLIPVDFISRNQAGPPQTAMLNGGCDFQIWSYNLESGPSNNVMYTEIVFGFPVPVYIAACVNIRRSTHYTITQDCFKCRLCLNINDL